MLDFIGIGLGPFNLSLASLLHEKTDLQYLFFEKKAQFDWHAGMQLPNTVLQVPFMADLVSMVDPTSPFSFLNYLKTQQRLYKFYFLEKPHIPRREYNHYCQWVADQLSNIHYQSVVKMIHPQPYGFEVIVEQHGQSIHYQCRHLVIGSGNVPNLPKCLQNIREQSGNQCLHSAEYLTKSQHDLKGNVVVLGSGQSAAEVFNDVFDRQYMHDQTSKAQFKLHWLTRSNGFFPMEYAPLGLEHFSPDYMQHFYQLDPKKKQEQLKAQSLLYKGISAKTIQEIYQKMYHRSIGGAEQHTHLHSHSELIDAEKIAQKIRLTFQHRVTQQQFYIDADYVVASTGYHTPLFEFMTTIEPFIDKDEHQQWKVKLNYGLAYHGVGKIYVQNQEMHSHGVGTPDLGLGAYRAAKIINQLVDFCLYPISEQAQCFQHFNNVKNPEIHEIPAHSVQTNMEKIFEQSSSLVKTTPLYAQSKTKLEHRLGQVNFEKTS